MRWTKQRLHALADAEKSGYNAIVVTVDAPFLGKREADEREGWAPLSRLPHSLLAHIDCLAPRPLYAC